MPAPAASLNPSNLLGIDYAAASASFAPPPRPIIDVHTHIQGRGAARVYARAARLYGVGLTFSMTAPQHMDEVAEALEGRVRFIATPDFQAADRRHAFGEGFIRRIEEHHRRGVRIVKFWAAPRGVDFGEAAGDPGLMRLDSPQRLAAMEAADALGMFFMTHVADPDTWFATKYADRKRYGSKRSQYDALEALLDRFRRPWIAAHMGGWPEDLEFLDGLLSRHDNLHLDCSAAKWMVRELSRHSTADLTDFLTRWKGRILFGSDIVTTDDHLSAAGPANELTAKSSSEAEAFDLYASRYWALRTLFESGYDGPSPIADPDLALIDPAHRTPMDAPRLRGHQLPAPILADLYHDAAARLLGEEASPPPAVE